MRNIVSVFIWVNTLLLVSSCGHTSKKSSQRPNIVFIMSDDHAYQAISAYDTSLIKTPNIDRIAHEGALFTKGFVTNSICAPSRAAILTGKHSFLNGKVDNVQKFNWDQESFPKLLRADGYQTALIGKIHLDGQPQGFDFSAVLPGGGAYYGPDFYVNGEKKTFQGYTTDIITEMSVDWLDQRDKSKPFCLLLHQKAPHREWLPAPRHLKEFTGKSYRIPSNLFDNYNERGSAAREAEMNILEHMNWAGDLKLYPEVMDTLGLSEYMTWDKEHLEYEFKRMTQEEKSAWDSTYIPINMDFKKKYPNMSEEDLMLWKYQRYMQDYLGSIASVDEGVGRVLDYLDENGLSENTIVVYTSDQGFYLGEHGWFDKRFMYEESFRTPILMRYPKEIKAGIKIDELVQNIDFAPTFLDYAGVEIPKSIQGLPFRKLFEQKNPQWRDAIYYTYYEYPSIHMVKRHYGVRTDRYKLIHFYYDVDEWELYDLENDPHEMNNIYGQPEYSEVQLSMHNQLNEIREMYGDSEENDQKFLMEYLRRTKKN